MADEYSKPPYNRKLNIPAEYNWESLTGVKGAALKVHYVTTLCELSTQKGILGQIFTLENKVLSFSALNLIAHTKGQQN